MKKSNIISTITRTWKRKILLLATGTAAICIPTVIAVGVWNNISLASILLCTGLLAFLVFWFVYQVYPDDQQSVRLVDRQLPQLEYSSQLLGEKSASGLLHLQQQIIEQRLSAEKSKLSYPLPWSMLGFNLFLTIFTGIIFISLKSISEDEISSMATLTNEDTLMDSTVLKQDSLYLTDLSISVIPPTYTGIPRYLPAGPDLEVPEGSRVRMDGSFSLPTSQISLRLNGDDKKHSSGKHDFSITSVFETKTVYQLRAESDTLQYASPYHLIDIKKDLPPQIEISDIPQYQRFDWFEDIRIDLTAQVTDDYALQGAYIVATITEGSGESIRFREQKISFDQPVKGKNMKLTKSWTGNDFQLGPGNEFYFHVEAIDNKPPHGQLTKSPTYFFTINDTSDIEFSLAGDLGVDIMPDYFKSQLQLIIETEKLIEDKISLPKEDFNFKSNELGFDQKQLRLRYGQFMGEEDESGIEVDREPASEPDNSDGDSKKVSVLDRFGHNTDRENEKGEWLDRGAQPAEEEDHDHSDHGHDHDHGDDELGDETRIEDPLEAFMHNHDDAETATFFTVSLKAKLRAALNEMWDAELYLRLFQPELSLPYQYKALKLLKEIKNHARIYVKRVGFEPIEIKEQETRLTKTPEDFSNASFTSGTNDENIHPALLNLIKEINLLNSTSKKTISRDIWQAAGDELASLSLEKPGEYLLELNTLDKLRNQKNPTNHYLTECQMLKERLIQQLFKESYSATIEGLPADELSDYFKSKLLEAGS
jgi:hypothetical protein